MFGRAVTAFRKSVNRSQSSTTLADANEEDQSIISDDLQTMNVGSHRRSSVSTRLSFLKKQRRSQSANREGDNESIISRRKK